MTRTNHRPRRQRRDGGTLERIMRRNSRKGHRLRAAVTRLDERYRNATVEVDAPAGFQWWDRRLPYA